MQEITSAASLYLGKISRFTHCTFKNININEYNVAVSLEISNLMMTSKRPQECT